MSGNSVSPGGALLALAATGWVVLLTLILRHRVYVSDDSVSNYAHVWWVASKLRHAHRLPFAMAVLGHGRGLAFPYAFVPWTAAALGWLAIGEWAVTAALVLGAALAVVATFAAFPELNPRRSRGAAAVVLANPALIASLWLGQLPFLWAVSFLLFGVAAWRRRDGRAQASGRSRTDRATVVAFACCALAQATHPAIVAPMALGLVLGWWRWEPGRRKLALVYLASTAVAAPAAWLVIASPVFGDSSTTDKVVNFAETFAVRALVVLVPLSLVLLLHAADRSHRLRLLGAIALAVLGLGQFVRIFHHYAWRAPVRTADTVIADFTKTTAFVPGKTYRVLRLADGKIGMYQILRAGGRLDSEFFPESQARRSFTDAREYRSFLRERRVDFVIVFASYAGRLHTNEPALLRLCGRRVGGTPLTVYDAAGCTGARPGPQGASHST